MKKNLLILLVIFGFSILSANVSWGNGTPLYEGNFIYGSHSTITASENLFITWAELDEGTRKLKLQKTDSAGIPIWNEPLTIAENPIFLMENEIFTYGDGCIISVYNQDRSEQDLYAIDENGNILWERNVLYSYSAKYLTFDNGNLLFTSIQRNDDDEYYISGTMIDGNGDIIWENTDLYSIGYTYNSSKIDCLVSVDGTIYMLAVHNSNLFLCSYNLNGELLTQSENYPVEYYVSSKFKDNNFFSISFNYETNNLEMFKLDLNGISQTTETPKIICETNSLVENNIAMADDYFYVITQNYEENVLFNKCDLDGNILDSYAYDIGESNYNIRMFDQEIDFVSNYDYETGDGYILILNEDGLSDPIYYLPEGFNNFWSNIYFINNNFTFAGSDNNQLRKVFTMRRENDETTIENIRDIEYQIIDPTLIMNGSNFMALWRSNINNGIMYQEFNENGEPLHAINGENFIDDAEYFKIFGNRIVIKNYDYENSTLELKIYSLDGEELMNQQIQLSQEYYSQMGIFQFYNKYIWISSFNTGNWDDNSLKMIAFDENGLIWSESIIFDSDEIDYFYNFALKGNNLFFRNSYTAFSMKLNENGSFEEPIELATNTDLLDLYDDENKYFVVTRDGITSTRDIHYFQNSELMWQTAWNVNLSDFGYINPIFEDDVFYQIGNHSQENITVNQYNYQHQLIPENSFVYDPVNQNSSTVKVYKDGDDFVFIIHSYIGNYQVQYSYMICDEMGDIIIPEFEETIMDREDMEGGKIIKGNDCIYMAIPCGFKPLEGEYQRNYYVQKIDLTGILGSEQNIIVPKEILSCYPNPFNPSATGRCPTTTIQYSVNNENENTEICIYNIKGQKVKQLIKDKMVVGEHSITWNGTDSANKTVGSGVYFYKLSNSKTHKTAKMLLLK